ncbi:MAG: nucleoid-associated protein [Clostridia bacterium]|nr:nucleoid-associated protein [Clostridia bacterium]
MRFCEDIAITQTIVHVIDAHGDEPLLGAQLLELGDETYMYLHNHIHKALNSDGNARGEFLINTSLVYTECLGMMEESDFVSASANIANHLFKVVKNTPAALSGDLVVVEIVAEGKKGIGLLFMEYKTSFVHDIKFEENQFKVDLKPQTISLPPKGQRLGKFAFFGESSSVEASYELIMMERTTLDENGEKVEFFISEFLQATVVLDYSDVTKLFRDQTEKWIRRNMKEDIGKALDVRTELDEQYVNSAEIDIKGTVNSVIDSIEEREKFLMNLEKHGVDTDQPFEIDKKWVGKKLKTKNIKTDTGFTIKGDYDFFDDSSRFEVQHNGDGTVNYIIKQVRNIRQI